MQTKGDKNTKKMKDDERTCFTDAYQPIIWLATHDLAQTKNNLDPCQTENKALLKDKFLNAIFKVLLFTLSWGRLRIRSMKHQYR